MADGFGGNPSKQKWGPAVTILSVQGWSRFLPHAGDDLVRILEGGPATKAAIAPRLGEDDEDLGWASPAWYEVDPEDEFTDQELEELGQQFAGFGAQSAEEANAEEAALRAAKIAAVDGYARGLGLGPVRTAKDALAYLLAARVVLAQGDQGAPEQVRYALNPSAPAPGEVLEIDEQEPVEQVEYAEQVDQVERSPHEFAAQAIIDTFYFRRGRAHSRRVTLQNLALEVDADVEHTRAGVGYLISDGDFSASTDVTRVAQREVFELAVDWDAFASNRLNFPQPS